MGKPYNLYINPYYTVLMTIPTIAKQWESIDPGRYINVITLTTVSWAHLHQEFQVPNLEVLCLTIPFLGAGFPLHKLYPYSLSRNSSILGTSSSMFGDISQQTQQFGLPLAEVRLAFASSTRFLKASVLWNNNSVVSPNRSSGIQWS